MRKRSAPLADRLAAGPNLFGDRLVIEPIGAQKHADPSGFQYERDAFFAGLIDRGFLEDQNFYIITGDRHWQYHSIHPTGFEEFSTGSARGWQFSAGAESRRPVINRSRCADRGSRIRHPSPRAGSCTSRSPLACDPPSRSAFTTNGACCFMRLKRSRSRRQIVPALL